ncbi:MAG: hypothetical protein ACJAR1_002871 [Rubritalea sp.]|jgi:hypothetical protein|tara:strand:+ start:197 stop:559 length:363 start_codon:yes stop_codon:yes gene_type:complete
MKMKLLLFMALLSGQLFASNVDDIKAGLMSADPAIANAAIDSCASDAKALLPKLRVWAGDPDPRLKVRARTALGRITGQWASQTDVIWKLSMEDALKESAKTGKPILMLHLFGNLNEEFC